MDFQLNDEQLQLKKSVREFAEREIAPNVRKWDDAGAPMEQDDDFIRLTPKGRLLSNEVFERFLAPMAVCAAL